MRSEGGGVGRERVRSKSEDKEEVKGCKEEEEGVGRERGKEVDEKDEQQAVMTE